MCGEVGGEGVRGCEGGREGGREGGETEMEREKSMGCRDMHMLTYVYMAGETFFCFFFSGWLAGGKKWGRLFATYPSHKQFVSLSLSFLGTGVGTVV